MTIRADCAFESLIKYEEELCGDKVELLRTEDSYIMILADGMGNGVKANILSTLTSKILGTMVLQGASLEECVDTIIRTLPLCQVRHVAYCTFSILQVFRDGQAYLVEFDNPACLRIRDGVPSQIPCTNRIVSDREIREAHFVAQEGDIYIMVSDGAIHAGLGKRLAFGWTWENMASYSAAHVSSQFSAARIAHMICQAANQLYEDCPGDDATVAVMRIIRAQVVHLLTGPPQNPASDHKMVETFMAGDAYRIVCGGTSAMIVSRELNLPLVPTLDFEDPEIPPIAYIQGIDLVTEGVITLNRAASLLRRYTNNPNSDDTLFDELDKKNAGSLIAKALIENCSDLQILVGKAINVAHQDTDLPFDLGIRQTLVEQIYTAVKTMGKGVTILYF
jgi:hypothetical protein